MAGSNGPRSDVRTVFASPWRSLSLVLATLVLAGAGTVVSRSGVFHVRNVDVEGSDHLTAPQVIKRAGLTEQTNVVWLDEGAVEDRLEQDPWVARASVIVDLPWSVRVRVVEREPIAVMEAPSGPALVAGDGTVLGPARRRGRSPLITTPPPWLRVGTVSSVAGAARALASMEADLRTRVSRVEITLEGTLESALRGGVRIAYGLTGGYAAKAEAIAEVLRWAERSGERLRRIDVSAPSAPAVTLG